MATSPSTNDPQVTVSVSQVLSELNTVKTGYKTSEFWIHLIYQVVDFAAVIAPNNPAVVRFGGALASLAGLATYVIGRSYVKGQASQAAGKAAANL